MTGTKDRVADAAHDCIATFEAIAQIQPPVSESSTTVPGLSRNEDGRSRFHIWMSNLGAAHPATDRRSADYRLREVPEVVDRVVELLEELAEINGEVFEIISGERTNRQVADSGSDSEKDLSPGNGQDELSELFLSIGDILTSLFRVSMLVKKATTRDRYARAAGAKDSPFLTDFDIRHVADKYPKARTQPWLLERLGTAITQRRTFLRYSRDHKSRIAHISSSDATAPVRMDAPSPYADKLKLSGITDYAPSSTKTPLTRPTLSPTTASTLQPDKIVRDDLQNLDDNDDAVSQSTSIAYSQTNEEGSGHLHVIRLQDLSQDNEPFECPYCFGIVQARRQRSWKKHVLSDLRAYVCMFEDCEAGLFEDKSAWARHDAEEHRRQWDCQHCRTPFSSTRALKAHLRSLHAGDELPAEVLEQVVKASSRPLTETAPDCPLCDLDVQVHNEADKVGKPITSGTQAVIALVELQRHLAFHQEQLALFAIPPAIERSIESESRHGRSQLDPNEHVRIMARWHDHLSEHETSGNPEKSSDYIPNINPLDDGGKALPYSDSLTGVSSGKSAHEGQPEHNTTVYTPEGGKSPSISPGDIVYIPSQVQEQLIYTKAVYLGVSPEAEHFAREWNSKQEVEVSMPSLIRKSTITDEERTEAESLRNTRPGLDTFSKSREYYRNNHSIHLDSVRLEELVRIFYASAVSELSKDDTSSEHAWKADVERHAALLMDVLIETVDGHSDLDSFPEKDEVSAQLREEQGGMISRARTAARDAKGQFFAVNVGKTTGPTHEDRLKDAELSPEMLEALILRLGLVIKGEETSVSIPRFGADLLRQTCISFLPIFLDLPFKDTAMPLAEILRIFHQCATAVLRQDRATPNSESQSIAAERHVALLLSLLISIDASLELERLKGAPPPRIRTRFTAILMEERSRNLSQASEIEERLFRLPRRSKTVSGKSQDGIIAEVSGEDDDRSSRSSVLPENEISAVMEPHHSVADSPHAGPSSDREPTFSKSVRDAQVDTITERELTWHDFDEKSEAEVTGPPRRMVCQNCDHTWRSGQASELRDFIYMVKDCSLSRHPTSNKFPSHFIDALEKRITRVLIGQEKMPEYRDALLKRTFALFLDELKDPTFRESMEKERPIEDLLSTFFSKAAARLPIRTGSDDDSWGTLVDRHVALFVRLIISVLEVFDRSRDGPESIGMMQALEIKLLRHNQDWRSAGTQCPSCLYFNFSNSGPLALETQAEVPAQTTSPSHTGSPTDPRDTNTAAITDTDVTGHELQEILEPEGTASERPPRGMICHNCEYVWRSRLALELRECPNSGSLHVTFESPPRTNSPDNTSAIRRSDATGEEAMGQYFSERTNKFMSLYRRETLDEPKSNPPAEDFPDPWSHLHTSSSANSPKQNNSTTSQSVVPPRDVPTSYNVNREESVSLADWHPDHPQQLELMDQYIKEVASRLRQVHGHSSADAGGISETEQLEHQLRSTGYAFERLLLLRSEPQHEPGPESLEQCFQNLCASMRRTLKTIFVMLDAGGRNGWEDWNERLYDAEHVGLLERVRWYLALIAALSRRIEGLDSDDLQRMDNKIGALLGRQKRGFLRGIFGGARAPQRTESEVVQPDSAEQLSLEDETEEIETSLLPQSLDTISRSSAAPTTSPQAMICYTCRNQFSAPESLDPHKCPNGDSHLVFPDTPGARAAMPENAAAEAAGSGMSDKLARLLHIVRESEDVADKLQQVYDQGIQTPNRIPQAVDLLRNLTAGFRRLAQTQDSSQYDDMFERIEDNVQTLCLSIRYTLEVASNALREPLNETQWEMLSHRMSEVECVDLSERLGLYADLVTNLLYHLDEFSSEIPSDTDAPVRSLLVKQEDARRSHDRKERLVGRKETRFQAGKDREAVVGTPIDRKEMRDQLVTSLDLAKGQDESQQALGTSERPEERGALLPSTSDAANTQDPTDRQTSRDRLAKSLDLAKPKSMELSEMPVQSDRDALPLPLKSSIFEKADTDEPAFAQKADSPEAADKTTQPVVSEQPSPGIDIVDTETSMPAEESSREESAPMETVKLESSLLDEESSTKRHKCPHCSKRFMRYHNLKSHLLMHSEEKPFVCQTCNVRFRLLHDLKRHSKLHTGERPYVCDKCGRRFAGADSLARHNNLALCADASEVEISTGDVTSDDEIVSTANVASRSEEKGVEESKDPGGDGTWVSRQLRNLSWKADRLAAELTLRRLSDNITGTEGVAKLLEDLVPGLRRLARSDMYVHRPAPSLDRLRDLILSLRFTLDLVSDALASQKRWLALEYHLNEVEGVSLPERLHWYMDLINSLSILEQMPDFQNHPAYLETMETDQNVRSLLARQQNEYAKRGSLVERIEARQSAREAEEAAAAAAEEQEEEEEPGDQEPDPANPPHGGKPSTSTPPQQQAAKQGKFCFSCRHRFQGLESDACPSCDSKHVVVESNWSEAFLPDDKRTPVQGEASSTAHPHDHESTDRKTNEDRLPNLTDLSSVIELVNTMSPSLFDDENKPQSPIPKSTQVSPVNGRSYLRIQKTADGFPKLVRSYDKPEAPIPSDENTASQSPPTSTSHPTKPIQNSRQVAPRQQTKPLPISDEPSPDITNSSKTSWPAPEADVWEDIPPSLSMPNSKTPWQPSEASWWENPLPQSSMPNHYTPSSASASAATSPILDCPHCPAQYTAPTNLRRHLRTHDIEEEEEFLPQQRPQDSQPYQPTELLPELHLPSEDQSIDDDVAASDAKAALKPDQEATLGVLAGSISVPARQQSKQQQQPSPESDIANTGVSTPAEGHPRQESATSERALSDAAKARRAIAALVATRSP